MPVFGSGLRTRALIAGLALGAGLSTAAAAPLPQGYWTAEQADAILSRTAVVRLDPDLSALAPAQRAAVSELIEAGRIIHRLYLGSVHHQALNALDTLRTMAGQKSYATPAEQLLKLYQLFKGPVATTPDNRRVPFMPVDAPVPGRNVYPWGVTRDRMDTFLAAHPQARDEILAPRTVVRATDRANLAADLATLDRHPTLATLHPGLEEHLKDLLQTPADQAFYAVPYSVAYADAFFRIADHLHKAADAIQASDPDFADYLRERAFSLISDDYEGGDAAWVTGAFGDLNAQIGSFETYDDKLYGVKTFLSLSVLRKDRVRSARLADAVAGIQAIENSLPVDRHKKVRTDIPVGVYDVIADFGQARSANTASILPNDSSHARKYGRTILLRYNIMTHPAIFTEARKEWAAAVAPDFVDDLTMNGNVHRTLWHEIGHYLGVATDHRGRPLDVALEQYSNLIEELKADLVSLYSGPELERSGYYDDASLRALYAAGIRRTLQRVRPRPTQPYQTMQLMQMNYFLDHGLLSFDSTTGKLSIDYSRYHAVVGAMLKEVLAIQSAGDPARAADFVKR
ncbi:MAG: NUDIX hydrolase, partial [Gammaproteobacteria bacterium]